jgi:hypothetical protein
MYRLNQSSRRLRGWRVGGVGGVGAPLNFSLYILSGRNSWGEPTPPTPFLLYLFYFFLLSKIIIIIIIIIP